jgi:hypothetical protein
LKPSRMPACLRRFIAALAAAAIGMVAVPRAEAQTASAPMILAPLPSDTSSVGGAVNSDGSVVVGQSFGQSSGSGFSKGGAGTNAVGGAGTTSAVL